MIIRSATADQPTHQAITSSQIGRRSPKAYVPAHRAASALGTGRSTTFGSGMPSARRAMCFSNWSGNECAFVSDLPSSRAQRRTGHVSNDLSRFIATRGVNL